MPQGSCIEGVLLCKQGPWQVARGGNHVPRDVADAVCGRRRGAWCAWRAAGMSRWDCCLIMDSCAEGVLWVVLFVGSWWVQGA